ncbi:MAG: sulfatase-like hydrolase/transferase [Bacteroidales bacterium]|nr:sulfatase-like hydrolase/transferase [Bacteroidales bacterium]
MKKLLGNRYGSILLMYVLFIITSFISRTVLLSMSFHEVNLGIFSLLRVYGVGLFFDTVAFSYFMIPFVLFLLLIPSKLYNSIINRWLGHFILFITIYIMLFNGVSEYFFWEEFGVRYNFIAVDYLIYTTEVIGNIRESYPLPLLLISIFIIDSAIMYLVIKKNLLSPSLNSKVKFKGRLTTGIVLLVLPILSFIIVDNTWAEKTENRYNNELSKNGVHSIFAAFINNELDYETFYIKKPTEENFTNLRSLIKSENSQFISDNVTDISQQVTNQGEEKRYNVIFITVESLSGEFLGYMGSKKGKITPYLDSIANNSILFTNFYATGTRTIWGLEAVALSAPPKPGQSVIKRPNNGNMFSLGHLFKARGYELKFIYGGNGYFDNMNSFYEKNGYTSIDKGDFEDNEINFENAWGVCDEDLLSKTIKEADLSFASGKPFLNLVMTTSNHRPFTYPNGRIDIISPANRQGAVKYTDYAIGDFIRKVQKKPWFNNTLIVIMADHCAGSAGQTELPVLEYQIPLIIYNPTLCPPQRIDKLSSQIDVAPTLLSMLNWTYKSKFFGKDIFKMTPTEERAFIANYQKLGFIKNDKIVILSPQQKVRYYQFNRLTGVMLDIPADNELLKDAVGYYQSSNYVYKKKLDRWE